ncbi:hypothetical protein [Nocardiopsis sp. CA-288880]|uniref:hypothetical protein n=1 Tax=Nocardiopsis sp. CA-288880 TaxID=3239995 RepID=UPI003D9696DD
MNATPQTPDGWRDLVCNAGLDRITTKAALNLADRFDGLPPKEGPREEPPAEIDTAIERVLQTLEDRGFLRVHEPARPEEGGFRYWLTTPPKDDGRVEVVIPTFASGSQGVGGSIFEVRPDPVRKRPALKSSQKRKGVRRRETVLYRYYDTEDVLLYVGISANMPGRLDSHETDSTWMDFAARSTLEHFGDRADAEAAEQAAIEADRPLFNILHNETPDRVRRLVDYLIDRDRRDLLVPLISRG